MIQINLSSHTPIYRQVADCIRVQLVGRCLLPGDRLPTVRDLAVDLGVNFNTIAAAYRCLAEEGWLDLKRSKGAVIKERPTLPKPAPEVVKAFGQQMREIAASVLAAGVARGEIAQELRSILHELEKPQ